MALSRTNCHVYFAWAVFGKVPFPVLPRESMLHFYVKSWWSTDILQSWQWWMHRLLKDELQQSPRDGWEDMKLTSWQIQTDQKISPKPPPPLVVRFVTSMVLKGDNLGDPIMGKVAHWSLEILQLTNQLHTSSAKSQGTKETWRHQHVDGLHPGHTN